MSSRASTLVLPCRAEFISFCQFGLAALTLCLLGVDISECVVANIAQETRDTIEADAFWCFSRLLDGIQVRLPAAPAAPLLLPVPLHGV